MNGRVPSDDHKPDVYETFEDVELPSSLDWRSKGYVTEVKNQGLCSNCWAFSTTELWKFKFKLWQGYFNNFRNSQVLHEKNYHGEEDQVRKAIFEENLKKIVQHNLEYDLGMHSYYLGINKYSDWSSEEFNQKMNGRVPSDDHKPDVYETFEDVELPSSLDWRSKGYVTEVKDQKHCGSCWAFSATGSLEGQHYRKTGKLISLSEQNLVDCSYITGNFGCGGGNQIYAYLYVKQNHGIDTEESYPYIGKNGACHYNKTNIGATCKRYWPINKDEKSLQKALAAVGPIAIAIDASAKEFHQYKGGVYNNPNCKTANSELDHAVLVVGYGQENGVDYWLVKNRYPQEIHGKNYQGEEEQVRKANFEKNLRTIVQHNLEYDLGMHTYYLGINKYSDMTGDELSKLMNGHISSNDHNLDLYEPIEDMELPSSLDWRDKGYVTEVKDQGDCGSCWSFSATGSLEGQLFRKTGKLVSLSEQNLVDCSSNYGCQGGEVAVAYNYVITNGINSEESYPYKPKQGDCHFNKSSIAGTCQSFRGIAQDVKILQQALARIGPISIVIDAKGDIMLNYKGGVFTNPRCTYYALGHAVLLVGYGTENGLDYWLVKNCWGESWGEKGYIKILRNEENLCGVASRALYPIV
ncbi:MCM2 [Cordylochernes scorpioides]|uniref:MCM2 n=1 Tax=Cordylochernes scorpioides TaxID=51811 RepID=A0ABY6JWG8_9ARAC|nr:MCM2 [Cordylochernes scorpioides]